MQLHFLYSSKNLHMGFQEARSTAQGLSVSTPAVTLVNESVAGNLQKSSTWISPQSLNRDLITQFPLRPNAASLLRKNTEGKAAASSIHDNTVTSLNNTSLSCLGKISPPFTGMKGGDLSPRLWIDTAAIPYDGLLELNPPSMNPSCLNGGGRHLLRQKDPHSTRRGFI